MSNTAISVRGLGKKYRLGATLSPDTLRDHVMKTVARLKGRNKSEKAPSRDFWALKDVSFDVQQGEVLGVIGPNGAGKSTLLKILTGITEPTEGEVRIKGRVASLLEVGTGFHLELSGRENIFMNGAILGMTQREIKAKFDEIVDFSGVEKFLDTPVKRYSSGMRIRLGFAVAAHLEPEILLIDEVLAVGDAEFQRKCLGKMEDVAKTGRTIIFVSHNMASIENLCSKAYLMKRGRIEKQGITKEVIGAYLYGLSVSSKLSLCQRSDRSGSGALRFSKIEFRGKETGANCDLVCGQPFSIFLHFICETDVRNPICSVAFYSLSGNRILFFSNRCTKTAFEILPRKGVLVCSSDDLSLVPGEYFVNVALGDSGGIIDHIENAASLHVLPADVYNSGYLPTQNESYVFCRHSWHLKEEG